MATSAFAALIAKYDTLTNVPPSASFDEPVSFSDVQKYPPYTVIVDDGMRPNFEFEHTACEVTDVTLYVICDTLAAVDTAVENIKYNGGSTTAGLGLDFGTLPALPAPSYQRLVVMRMSERRFAFKPTGKEGQRIHACELKYRITLYRY